MKPSLEVADIFNRYGDQITNVSTDSFKVVRAITNCRTERLGRHLRTCSNCAHEEISFNSCRNRHCPKCQFMTRVNWVTKREEELLPLKYFHVVFTLPSELNPLILQNKATLYDLLFKASAETLKEVARRKKNMGADLGFIGVLHTWGQNLMDHPHVHYIVPGGGLKQKTLVQTRRKYLLPVKILSQVFKAKFLSDLEKLHGKGKLQFHGQIENLSDITKFKELLVECARKSWVVYAKQPFNGPKQVISYLGQYTHRIAISNHRLIKIEDERVHFKYRDSRHGNQSKIMSLHVKEFMRRFLLHVLPRGFVRIRHFGILASRLKKETIKLMRNLMAAPIPITRTVTDVLLEIVGTDITQCPQCKAGVMTLKSSSFPWRNTA
jgi:hypothetical protein